MTIDELIAKLQEVKQSTLGDTKVVLQIDRNELGNGCTAKTVRVIRAYRCEWDDGDPWKPDELPDMPCEDHVYENVVNIST